MTPLDTAIKNVFDFHLSLIGLIFFMPVIFFAWLIASYDTKSNGIFIQERVGKNGKLFKLYKIKTMKEITNFDTSVTQENDPRITKSGRFFRKTKIDELPQLFNVLMGHMSFVGPRPALFNQEDLKKMRTEKGAHKLKPGLTGLAQINGRDEISLEAKVKLDAEYLRKNNIGFDIQILWKTALKVLRSDGISH